MAGLFDEVKGLAGQIVSKMEEANAGLADEKAASYKEGYDKGYEEGKASIVLPKPTLPDGSVDPELQYTQAQMNEAVNTAVEKQKADDVVALEGVQKDLEAAKLAAAAVDEAKAALAKLQAKYDVLVSAIDVEIADVKADSERLEKAKASIVEAPVEPQA